MNILHLIPTNQFSGAEKVVLLLCKYNQDNKVVVACGEQLAERYKSEGIQAEAVNFHHSLRTIRRVYRIITDYKIQIIHAHDNQASIIAYLVKKIFRLNVKVVSHIHNSYTWLQNPSVYRVIDRTMRNRYDLNIFCGKVIQQYYQQYGNYIHLEKTSILSNAIHEEGNDQPKAKESLGLDGAYVYGFVGRLSEQKGLHPFIDALNTQKESFRKCKFLLIGNGEDEETLKGKVKEYQLEDQFVFLDFQADIQSYYPLIDVFFLPSKYEGLPMVILEAMLFKRCIVAMDVGSISEVIHEGQTGYLIPSGDYQAFVDKLRELQQGEHQGIGQAAYELVNKEYRIESKVRDLNQLYLSI